MTALTPADWPPPGAADLGTADRAPRDRPSSLDRGRRWIRVLRPLLIAAAIGASMLLDANVALFIPVLFVLVVPFEKLFPRHRQRLRRRGLGTDLTYALLQPLLTPIAVVVGVVVSAVSLVWVPALALRPLVAALPSWVTVVLGALLFDLAGYWAHRWSHELPFLWRFHAVHHSSPELDWISGLRNHPLDGALLAPAFVFLLGAGFSIELAGVLAIIQIATGLFLHANVRWRWRPLHRVVATPEFHHWHHADERDARNTNYGTLFPLWDVVFGSYFMPVDRRPAVYGVTPALPHDFFEQLAEPLRGLHRPRWILRHPIAEARHLVRSAFRGVRQIVASTAHPRRPREPQPVGGES